MDNNKVIAAAIVLAALIIGLFNRYEVVPLHNNFGGAIKLDKLTGKQCWLTSDTVCIPISER